MGCWLFRVGGCMGLWSICVAGYIGFLACWMYKIADFLGLMDI